MRLEERHEEAKRCLGLWAENAELYSVHITASHEVDSRTNLRVPSVVVVAVIKAASQRIIMTIIIRKTTTTRSGALGPRFLPGRA